MKLKIGILLATDSTFLPLVGQDFLAGIKSGIASNKTLECKFAIELIGNGGAANIVIEKAQKLLLMESPDIIITNIGAGVANELLEITTANKMPLIINNIGADMLHKGTMNEYVFYNSYNLTQSCFNFGHWAATHMGKTACTASGFHEAGYDLLGAFWEGYTLAGGTVKRVVITHKSSTTEDPTTQINEIVAEKPDFVIAFYSGKESISFINTYKELGLVNKLPLVVSPFALHKEYLGSMNSDIIGLNTFGCWELDAVLADWSGFKDYKMFSEHEPDVFSLLGYESGLLIANSCKTIGGDSISKQELINTLKIETCESPRGIMKFNSHNRRTETVDLLFKIKDNHLFENIQELPRREEFQHYETKMLESDQPRGWLNPYLIG